MYKRTLLLLLILLLSVPSSWAMEEGNISKSRRPLKRLRRASEPPKIIPSPAIDLQEQKLPLESQNLAQETAPMRWQDFVKKTQPNSLKPTRYSSRRKIHKKAESDEENESEEISEDESIVLSNDEDETPIEARPPRSLKRLRRASEPTPKIRPSLTQGGAKISWQEFSEKPRPDPLKSNLYSSRKKVDAMDESEEETETEETYKANPIALNNEKIIVMGTQLKLLANVYLRNLDEMANVFFPYYTLTIQGDSGEEEISDYFRAPAPKGKEEPQGKICVFASGGLHNAWEKTVARIQEIFFGDKVKVIRASWIQNI